MGPESGVMGASLDTWSPRVPCSLYSETERDSGLGVHGVLEDRSQTTPLTSGDGGGGKTLPVVDPTRVETTSPRGDGPYVEFYAWDPKYSLHRFLHFLFFMCETLWLLRSTLNMWKRNTSATSTTFFKLARKTRFGRLNHFSFITLNRTWIILRLWWMCRESVSTLLLISQS